MQSSLIETLIHRIIQTPEKYAAKLTYLPSDIGNKIVKVVIQKLTERESAPKSLWKIPYNEVAIDKPRGSFLPSDVHILFGLRRAEMKKIDVTGCNFEKCLFSGDMKKNNINWSYFEENSINAFHTLHTLRIQQPQGLTKEKLLNLCALLSYELKEFIVTDCDAVDDEMLQVLAKQCPNLEILCVAGCKNVTTVEDRFEKLIALDVSGTKCNDTTIGNIINMDLLSLNFSNTAITDTGIELLASCFQHKLRKLSINNCHKVTSLGDGFQQLKVLDIEGTSIDISKLPCELLVIHNAQGISLFHEAIFKDNIDLANKILQKIISEKKEQYLGSQDAENNTALHWACYKEQSELAYALIKKMDPATFGLQGSYKSTSLHWAIDKNLDAVAKQLIEKMDLKDLSLEDDRGITPLRMACCKGNSELALALIEKMDPAMLGLQGSYKSTPLHWAIDKNLDEVAKKLIEKMDPKDLSIQDGEGDTALHWACIRENQEIALALIKKMDSETLGLQGARNRTALQWAIDKNLNTVAQQLIEKMDPKDLSLQNDYENTALHLACYKGDSELALALIKKMDSAMFSLQGTYKKTALHWAIHKDLNAVAKQLIEKMNQNDLSIQDDDGNSALYRACDRENQELALALIKKMDSEAFGLQGTRNRTALHRAIEKNLDLVAKKLIEKMHPRDLELKNQYAENHYHMAERFKKAFAQDIFKRTLC